MNATSRSRRALFTVLATIGVAVLMTAVAPGARTDDTPDGLAGLRFVAAWTNDDGTVDGVDVGDDASPGVFDVWPGLESSVDPMAVGLDAPRILDDVAKCAAAVRALDADFVDVEVLNAYPGYICSFRVMIENVSGFPVEATSAAVDVDDGLLVHNVSDPTGPVFPLELAPGATIEREYSVQVLNEAEQGATLTFSLVGVYDITEGATITIFWLGDFLQVSFVGDLGTFLLDLTEGQSFVELLPGDYTVSLILPPAGDPNDTTLECETTSGESSFTLDAFGGTADITLADGDEVICRFANESALVTTTTTTTTTTSTTTTTTITTGTASTPTITAFGPDELPYTGGSSMLLAALIGGGALLLLGLIGLWEARRTEHDS